MKKLFFIFTLISIFAIHSYAQKGIGMNGFITDIGTGQPIGDQQIFIAIDSIVYPYVQTINYSLHSHPDGSFSAYIPYIPHSAFPLKILVYTYDCDYQRVGYEITYYYDNVSADSVFIEICSQATNLIDIDIDNDNQSCPTFAHLENEGIRNWPHLYESFTWYVNQEEIGYGNEINYFFENAYNDVMLKAVLKDSLTGFTLDDSLVVYEGMDFPSSYFHILAGNVLSGLAPVDFGTAILLRNCNSAFEYVDTIYFDTLGYYYFNNIPQCNYSVKITDAFQGTSLPVIPTYLNDELHWAQCSHINLTQNEFQKNINLYLEENISGPGSISGYILPQPDLSHDIILYNSSMEPLLFAFASDDGLFEFPSLPYGTYILYSERYGYNSMSSFVTISANEPNAIVYLQQAASMDEYSEMSLQIFPSPASEKIYIKNANIEGLEIFDSRGRIVLNTKYSAEGIDISALEPGFYIIKANDRDLNIMNAKFLKN
ncbi:MAG: T9SS type A sorting domain-containing protein [Bacteroidales bacterium]|nr:T9SS type A sorting domain-containing protein [Bacteroidales bacterium]